MDALTAVRGPVRLSGKGWPRAGVQLGQNATPPEDAQLSDIESAVTSLAVEVQLRTDRLVSELEISQDPELKGGVSLVGMDLSSQELAGQVALVAGRLVEFIDSISSGPLASYTSESASQSFTQSRDVLVALERQASTIAAPLQEGHEGLAEEHLLSYVEDLRDLRDAAERMVVATEQAPPVLEPGEKALSDASGMLWTLGALSAGAILLMVFTGE